MSTEPMTTHFITCDECEMIHSLDSPEPPESCPECDGDRFEGITREEVHSIPGWWNKSDGHLYDILSDREAWQ